MSLDVMMGVSSKESESVYSNDDFELVFSTI